MIIWVRSLLFTIFFFLWTAIACVLCLPLLLMPVQICVLSGRIWSAGVIFGARIFAGIKFEVRGRENIPEGGAIIAAKHQSAWETIVFYSILDSPVYVLKKGLEYIPIFGWYFKRIRTIAVDRSAGASALKHLIHESKDRVARGRQIIIFPEGTRVPYREKAVYQSGIMAIYKSTGLPVTPVALNSGKCWPKNSFKKMSGTIVMEFLPAISPGLKKSEFMTVLEEKIEAACNKM